MKKEQIEETLKKFNIQKDSGCKLEYERARRIMLSRPVSPDDRDLINKTISDYVRV